MMGLEIGERRRIESELRIARERYRRLVEDLPAVVYLWDLVHRNGEKAPTGTRAGTRVHESARPGPPRLHRRRSGAGRASGGRACIRTTATTSSSSSIGRDARESRSTPSTATSPRTASIVWVVDRATMLERDGSGLPSLFQGVLLDITDRKEAERKAQEIESWYMRLAQESPGIVWVVSDRDEDPQIRWRHYFVNAREQDLLGYQLDEFAGPALWRSYLHPDDRARVIEENEHIWRTGAPWGNDLRMIAKDGRVIWFHLQGRTVEFDERGRPEVYQGCSRTSTRASGGRRTCRPPSSGSDRSWRACRRCPGRRRWIPATGLGPHHLPRTAVRGDPGMVLAGSRTRCLRTHGAVPPSG